MYGDGHIWAQIEVPFLQIFYKLSKNRIHRRYTFDIFCLMGEDFYPNSKGLNDFAAKLSACFGH